MCMEIGMWNWTLGLRGLGIRLESYEEMALPVRVSRMTLRCDGMIFGGCLRCLGLVRRPQKSRGKLHLG